MELNIRVGDRVTYKYKDEIYTKMIFNYYDLGDLLSNKEILKIERPQYEEIYKKGVIAEHITIETDKLKELILENHSNYMNVPLKTKAKIVSKYAEFDNDTELLEFLEFMEE